MPQNKEQKVQELYMEFQMLDQHIKQIQKQLEAVTQQMIELTVTTNSLDEFNAIKPGKEIFVPLSSGIFAKASITSNSELLVNVGANVVVQKNVDSTKKLIQRQMEEVKKVQHQMVDELEKMTHRAAQLEMQLQGIASQG